MNAETESGWPMKGAKILVVDDVAKNIQVLGTALRDAGCEVIPAMSGEQALRSAETHHPDLILLDVMMPEMDGHEVLERLRGYADLRDTPVIFVTALSDQEDEKAGLEMGAVDYITKPINIPITLARVRTHLTLKFAREMLAKQNLELIEAAKIREDVERITRHDLKNPLQVVIAGPTVIKDLGELTEHQVKLLDSIVDAGHRMLDMINRSLDLYKMERGVYQLRPERVNLIAVLTSIEQETQRLAARKNLSLRVLLADQPVTPDAQFEVWGEELLCYSMFANLIKNAFEASPARETVTATLCPGEAMAVRIHNQGAVPLEIRDSFFEKYATAGKQQGTGLGTYSAQLIAHVHQGAIRMETDDTTGTTITVELPRPPSEGAPQNPD